MIKIIKKWQENPNLVPKRKDNFWIAVYVIISLSVFLIPPKPLTRFPFLNHFTNFMSFIPAVDKISNQSLIPETSTLYTAYMFVVGFIFFFIFLYQSILLYIWKANFLNINKVSKKEFDKFTAFKRPKLSLFFISFLWIGGIYVIINLINGNYIGHRTRGASTYMINTNYELLYYSLFQQFIVIYGLSFIVAATIALIEYYFFRKNTQ